MCRVPPVSGGEGSLGLSTARVLTSHLRAETALPSHSTCTERVWGGLGRLPAPPVIAGPPLHAWLVSWLQGRPGPCFAIAPWPFWSPFMVTQCWWCRNTGPCGPEDSRVCQALRGLGLCDGAG